MSGQSGDPEESGQLSLLTNVLYLGQIISRIGGTSIFLNDFSDDGQVDVLLDDVDQLSLIELSGLTIGLELDDLFIDRHPSLFEFPKLLPSPMIPSDWLVRKVPLVSYTCVSMCRGCRYLAFPDMFWQSFRLWVLLNVRALRGPVCLCWQAWRDGSRLAML